MKIKYNIDIQKDAVLVNLNRLTNQIYKLLPTWEEGLDWRKPLATVIEEIAGMSELFVDHQVILMHLLCKLQGLFIYETEEDFFIFRKTIFECLTLIGEVMKDVQSR